MFLQIQVWLDSLHDFECPYSKFATYVHLDRSVNYNMVTFAGCVHNQGLFFSFVHACFLFPFKGWMEYHVVFGKMLYGMDVVYKSEVEGYLPLSFIECNSMHHLCFMLMLLFMNILFLFCQVLIATQSQRVVEKEVETNKKMKIGDTEKSANIIKILMKQELMEKDSSRKHQEIENQMYTAQGKSKTMQISIGISSYLLMIAIEKII